MDHQSFMLPSLSKNFPEKYEKLICLNVLVKLNIM